MVENPTDSGFAAKGTCPKNNFSAAILNMGFHDLMPNFNSDPVQTHRHVRSKFPYELDHMFAAETLYARLTKIQTVEVPELSDYDLIVADSR